jgi:large subunit ribosomal protein L9
VRIALHPEVDAHVTINVARSPDEAQLQADPDMAAARAAADEAERREIEAEFAALGAAAEEDDIVNP